MGDGFLLHAQIKFSAIGGNLPCPEAENVSMRISLRFVQSCTRSHARLTQRKCTDARKLLMWSAHGYSQSSR